jgi:hypothetical protein
MDPGSLPAKRVKGQDRFTSSEACDGIVARPPTTAASLRRRTERRSSRKSPQSHSRTTPMIPNVLVLAAQRAAHLALAPLRRCRAARGLTVQLPGANSLPAASLPPRFFLPAISLSASPRFSSNQLVQLENLGASQSRRNKSPVFRCEQGERTGAGGGKRRRPGDAAGRAAGQAFVNIHHAGRARLFLISPCNCHKRSSNPAGRAAARRAVEGRRAAEQIGRCRCL